MLAFLWVIWLRLVKRNMLENTNIQVPKCYSLKLFRTSHTNVCFWKIPSDILESQKPECKLVLVQLQSKMHDLEKIKQILPGFIPEVSQRTNLSRDMRLSWNPRILMGLASDMLKCSRVSFFLLPSHSISCHPTQPWIFNIVLSECPCYKELFRNT